MKLQENTSLVEPGIYQHYKGPKYQVLGTATHSESEEVMVVYQTLYGKFDYWVRPLAMFGEEVKVEGKLIPRFRKIAEEEI